jgi:ubiquinone/menaquinone biosynthesis C-methylase UbiE
MRLRCGFGSARRVEVDRMTTNRQLERIQEQFRRQADAYERLATVTDAEGMRRLVRLTQPTGAERVLDVACGPAFLTMAFAEATREVVGLDGTDVFLAHAAAEARRRGHANLRLALGDVERMPLADVAFDVVACRAAFHHFPDPEIVLREMVRVTRPGARFLIADQVASEDATKARLHNEVERLCDPTHVRALPVSELAALFARLGLAVVFEGSSEIEYSVEEWMTHGGPAADVAEEIRRRMRDSIDGDKTALGVRETDGELRFHHTAAAFVLEKPA